MFVTWLRKLFFPAVFSVVTKNGCVADYNVCALGCIKILFFPRCWNVYFTLDSQEPAEERASVIYTSTSEQRQQGMKEGWGRMNRIGSDRARESLEYFGSARGNSKLRNCTWRRCLYLKTNKRKTVWKGKASNSSFFPLQLIMSTTGKYSRAVCQSYRGSSKS